MNNEPRLMEVPGIPGQLKEANLEEFMSALPMDHLAQRQLSELRKLAMDCAKVTAELLEALKKIRELEGKLSHFVLAPVVAPMAVEDIKPYWPKAPCPKCKLEISTQPGPWASHMKRRHNLTGVPRPKTEPIGNDQTTEKSIAHQAAA